MFLLRGWEKNWNIKSEGIGNIAGIGKSGENPQVSFRHKANLKRPQFGGVGALTQMNNLIKNMTQKIERVQQQRRDYAERYHTAPSSSQDNILAVETPHTPVAETVVAF